MAPPIIKMSEYQEIKNVLLYGDTGIGKTVFTGGCGLILATEQGLVSAKRHGSKADLWMIESWQGTPNDRHPQNNVREAYKWLANGGFQKYRDKGQWVGLDGITEMQEMAKLHLVAEAFDVDPATQSEFVLEWQGNLELQARTKAMVKNFCKIPVNMLFTALPMVTEDKSGNDKLMPLIDGKKGAISQYCCAQMGAVGYMRMLHRKVDGKSKEIRRIDWKYRKTEDMAVFGKNRFGLPPYTDDLDLAHVVNLMESEPAPTGTRRTTRTPAARRRVASTTK